ncbi:hypothetical protein V5O48_009563 [Marasmius crinis-equi]|uniref:Uncharacterized protein n=1 Tax=Marasmius crinis-equi TaxID=585013 RepID=A0ABR3FAS4_9AGAR
MAETPSARDSNTQSSSPLPLRRSLMSASPRISTHSYTNSMQPEIGRRDSHQMQSDPVLLLQNPPRGPLHTTNPDEDGEEFMMIDADSALGNGMGYHNGPAKLKREHRAKKKRFGGLVKGLRRFTGSVLGYPVHDPTLPLENTSTGNTLPRYVSNPTTPVATELPRRPLPTAPHPDVVDGIPPALLPGVPRRRPPPPAFRVTPPPPVSQRTSHHSEHPSIYSGPHHVERVSGTPPVTMPTPVTTQSNEEAAVAGPSRRSTSHQSHLEPSPHPTRIDVEDDDGTIGRLPSAKSPVRQPTIPPIPSTPNPEAAQSRSRPRPTSIPVRPLPTEDYRRMSKSIHNTAGSSTTSYDPSFSTELNPAHGFFHTLWHMPWVSPDRITVDYIPGMSRGAWQWKKVVIKPQGQGGDQSMNEKPRTAVEYKPIAKPIKSWYTGVPPVSRDSMPRWSRSGDPEAGGLDLLSSGTSGTRSSMATSGPGSSIPAGRRKRFSPHRESRTLFYSPNQYVFTDVGPASTPPLRVKKKVKEEYRSRRTKHSSSSRPYYERRHRRHKTAHTVSPPPPVPPVPPAAYMHGYAPYQPSAPIYLLPSPSYSHAQPVHPHIDPRSDPHAYQHLNQQQLLSPLFMVPGVPAVVPFQGEGSTGTASPPGVAGRGAGGGYGPPGASGNFPGGYAFGGMSPASPKANANPA